jgi:transposase
LIVYDKFHVLRHLSTAMDEVRRAEYARLEGKERRFIKGQRFNLSSNKRSRRRARAITCVGRISGPDWGGLFLVLACHVHLAF